MSCKSEEAGHGSIRRVVMVGGGGKGWKVVVEGVEKDNNEDGKGEGWNCGKIG